MSKPLKPDRAEEIAASSMWEDVCGEIDFRITQMEKTLRYVKKEDLEVKQAEIQALEALKHLPQDVMDREAA